IALAEPDELAPGRERPEVLAVRGHHALRVAGRPRREDEVREVVGRDRESGGARVGFRNRSRSREKILPRDCPVGRTPQHDLLCEIRQVLAAERMDEARAEEVAHRAEDLRSALPEDVARLAALHPRAERHQHAARRLRAERRDDPLREVRSPDGDAVAGADARSDEGARGAKAGPGELGEGEPDATVLDRAALAEALCRREDEPRNRRLHGERDLSQALRPFHAGTMPRVRGTGPGAAPVPTALASLKARPAPVSSDRQAGIGSPSSTGKRDSRSSARTRQTSVVVRMPTSLPRRCTSADPLRRSAISLTTTSRGVSSLTT